MTERWKSIIADRTVLSDSNFQQRILVAEDDELNRDVIVRYLANEGYEPVVARDGLNALRLSRSDVDLAIMDLGLPAIDGLNVIRTLRSERIGIPIIVVSARVDEVERLVAFEAGADDYLAKPFLPRELMCRVRARLRRSAFADDSAQKVRRSGPLEFDGAARELRFAGVRIVLRPREFDLLSILISNPGVALARATLIERAFGDDFNADERAVDGHVRRIRQKLEPFPTASRMIETIHGFGYKFVAPADSAG